MGGGRIEGVVPHFILHNSYFRRGRGEFFVSPTEVLSNSKLDMNLSLVNFTAFNIPEKFFKDIAQQVFKKEGVKRDVSLEVVLLGRSKMREINKRYAGRNRITDVLSFPESEVRKPTKKEIDFIQAKEGEESLGEILLCPSRIKKNARKLKKDFKQEMALVFIHGILHLLGYDHTDTKSTRIMQKKEKEIMDACSSILASFKIT